MESIELRKYIGHQFKIARLSRDLSLEQVAARLGVSIPTVSTYESGKRRIPFEHIIYLCNFYELSVNEVINVQEYNPKSDKLYELLKENFKGVEFTRSEIMLIVEYAKILLKYREPAPSETTKETS